MPDAEVIPIGTRGRPGRGTGQKTSAAARRLAPGAAPADAAKDAPADPPKKKAAAKKSAAKKAAAEESASTKSATKSAEKSAAQRSSAAKSAKKPAKGTARQPAAKPTARRINPLIAVGDEPDLTRTGPGPTGEQVSGGPAAPPEPPTPSPASAVAAPARSPAAELVGALAGLAADVLGADWERQAAEMLAFCRRRLTGDYAIDDFGFDPEFTDTYLLSLLAPVAEKWFRIEVRGVENIPADGAALVVSNHSGTVPVDGLMTLFCIHRETGRHLRALGADLVFSLPVISTLARRGGATLACHEDAERMLRGGELVGVWPEGFKGIGKPFSERYKLQRFGRGGFVSAAMRTGVPIVPLSVVGAEEIYPLVGNVPSLARLLGLPFLPITPFFPWLGPLGMLPLPSKWIIEFGEPIRTDEYDAGAADDPMLVFNVTDQVRETIQQTLYRLLLERPSVFGR